MEIDVNLLQNTLYLPLSFQETISVSSVYGLCEDRVAFCFDGSLEKKPDDLVGFYTLKGHLRFTLFFLCDKCLERVALPVQLDVCENFVKTVSQSALAKTPESGGSPQEDFFCFYGESIDISQAFETLIYLSIPPKVVCGEECRGLCPHCGCNLNQGNCNCGEAGLDPRFTVLQSFFKS